MILKKNSSYFINCVGVRIKGTIISASEFVPKSYFLKSWYELKMNWKTESFICW